jgi:hypothetical protein
MNLQFARGLFFLGSLAVTTAAFAAWDEPRPGVLRAEAGQGVCLFPRAQKSEAAAEAPPGHNMLLLMLGLTQGLRSGA